MVDNINWETELEGIEVVTIKDEEIEEITGQEGYLGQGTFGTVRKGKYKGEHDVAIKELIFNSNENTAEEVVNNIRNEIKAFSIAEKLHPSIVKFYGVWKQKTKICFVFELIKGKDFHKVAPEMNDKEKLQAISDICDVIGTLHNKKLIHRDIKPANVMIQKEGKKVRIIDFGTVKIAKNENTFTVNQKGTDNYMSPELIKIIELDGDEENDLVHFSVSPKVDVWAIGCVISEVFSGELPWKNLVGLNFQAVRKKLLKNTPFPIPEQIKNPKIVNLIKMACEVNLDKRCSIFELKEAVDKVISEL